MNADAEREAAMPILRDYSSWMVLRLPWAATLRRSR